MPTFDSLPDGSPVLLTLPVLIYGIFTKHPDHSYPLSADCSVILENCRTGRFQGMITTAVITRCWTVLQRLETRVEEPEIDPDDYDWRGERILSKPVTGDSVPKRVAALLGGQLRIATVETQDFDQAGDLVRDLSISADLALDIAAVIREFNIKPLTVALTKIDPWPAHSLCVPYWCKDLPWQPREIIPPKTEAKAEKLPLEPTKLVLRYSEISYAPLPPALDPTSLEEALRFCATMERQGVRIGMDGCSRAQKIRQSIARSEGNVEANSPARLCILFDRLASFECGCHEKGSYEMRNFRD